MIHRLVMISGEKGVVPREPVDRVYLFRNAPSAAKVADILRRHTGRPWESVVAWVGSDNVAHFEVDAVSLCPAVAKRSATLCRCGSLRIQPPQ